MDPISRESAGRSIPHCEVVSRTLDPFRDVNPSGVARLRWAAVNGVEHFHDLHHWLRLDELLTPGMKFRVELQARREPDYDLPMFSAQRDFLFTGNTNSGADVAVGFDGVLGWVYGVVVVGADPAHDTQTTHTHEPNPAVDVPAAEWGVLPGHVLQELFTDSFPALRSDTQN